jgi:hypothetical protein
MAERLASTSGRTGETSATSVVEITDITRRLTAIEASSRRTPTDIRVPPFLRLIPYPRPGDDGPKNQTQYKGPPSDDDSYYSSPSQRCV